MFLVHCPACGRRELRGARSLVDFATTDRGIELALVCTCCGTEVRMVTGRLAAAHPSAAAAGARPAA
jgi:hypothetical protein